MIDIKGLGMKMKLSLLSDIKLKVGGGNLI